MSLIRWKPKKCNVLDQPLSWDDSLFGLTLFPFDKFFSSFDGGWSPAVDVYENKGDVTLKVDLPGVEKDGLRVTVQDGSLLIAGERKLESEKKEKGYHRLERFYGSFQRNIYLGPNIDTTKIKASYKNGVLEIVVPRSEEAKPRELKIEVE